jgi:hypothetical protein
MGRMVEGFSFSDFCLKCQKVSAHRIEIDNKEFFGVCPSCSSSRRLMGVHQVYYPKTDLWVTRFKIGNLPSVVAGKLLDAGKEIKS